jgi:hypothetical protein
MKIYEIIISNFIFLPFGYTNFESSRNYPEVRLCLEESFSKVLLSGW